MQTINLKDYKPSPFLIDNIFLTVDILKSHTEVKSVMTLQKSTPFLGKKTTLELSGENLKFKSVKLNGNDLASSDYELTSDKLRILDITADQFILEVHNDIDPENNKACEGFYKSGDQYCTQCEPEGFRKITYFLDRPDVMAKYKTRMSADKEQFPFLLSNGNRTDFGDLPNGRHFVEWEDPFRKPSYLFAMVAGDFDVARGTFVTMKNRKIDLEIYVDKGNLLKTPHAINSLKKSMKWDEETFGLEYDLDIYMIVAVDSFNMGAMENKGLNIFNSTYTLADQTSATDQDFQNIEGVIGHEYFHNWTGNRVTCRDWFQLTLKEGLTVFRDQEFSSDMLSRAVKRIEDVRMLKEQQFAEDAGPLSHPIRPESYIEINNFYTRTIYEKGAEVIRMIHTLVGASGFRKGMDKYFELFDGQAVTTDDFVHAMEIANKRDLTQFKNWYSRSGTPTLEIKSTSANGATTLEIFQKYPETKNPLPPSNVLHMPFNLAFISKDGTVSEHSLELTKLSESFSFKTNDGSVLSLNRNFSAPVIINYKYSFSDLLHIMGHETDAYCKYEAAQQVYTSLFKTDFDFFKNSGALRPELSSEFKASFEKMLSDESMDESFKSYLLSLPSESFFIQDMLPPDFEAIPKVRANLIKKIGLAFHEWFLSKHIELSGVKGFELTPKAYGARALKNQCLSFLSASGSGKGSERLNDHYKSASNMTEEIHALTLFIKSGVSLEHESVVSFYKKWKHDSLVMLKWFSALAAHTPKELAVQRLEALEKDPVFKKDVPNYLRALYVTFAKSNLSAFHSEDGSGYDYMARKIKWIDSFNPQVASRGATAFSLVNRVDNKRSEAMKASLGLILEGSPSRDTFEVVSKYLA